MRTYIKPMQLMMALLLGSLSLFVNAESARTQETRALMTAYFEAMQAGDSSKMLEYWAEDDSTMRQMNKSPWGGYYFGRQAVSVYFDRMAGMFNLQGGLRVDLRVMVADGDQAVVRYRVRAQHKLGSYDNEYHQIYTWRDGQIVEMESFYDWGPFEQFRQRALKMREAG